MPMSQSADGHARRKSTDSSSRASLVTVKALEPSNPTSRTRLTPEPTTLETSHGTGEGRKSTPNRRSRSSSAKRSSGVSHFNADDSRGEGKKNANRLSRSTTSSQESEKKKRKSGSGRLSLAPSSLSTKGATEIDSNLLMKRRKADESNNLGVSDSSARSSRRLPPAPVKVLSGDTSTLSADLYTDATRLEGPRTPLLFEGQISGFDSGPMKYPTAESQALSSAHHMGLGFNMAEYRRRLVWQPEPDDAPDTEAAGEPMEVERPNDEVIEETRSDEPRATPGTQTTNQQAMQEKLLHQREVKDDIGRESSAPGQGGQTKGKDKKTMLALALQRANDAVQLDDEDNFEGAVAAYMEACDHLTYVMERSSSADDIEKLHVIRTTYHDRIREIRQLGVPLNILDYDKQANNRNDHLIIHDSDAYGETPVDEPSQSHLDSLKPYGNDAYIPAPLTPRRPSPQPPDGSYIARSQALNGTNEFQTHNGPEESYSKTIATPDTWLDNLEDKSDSSRTSHTHQSISSLRELRRQHIRAHSSNTEAEFDAALDAAVEAAYDDSYQPYMEHVNFENEQFAHNPLQESRPVRDPYLAGRADRLLANNRRHLDQPGKYESLFSPHADFDLDSDEEDRLLNLEQEDVEKVSSANGSQPHAKAPRQSDSSSSSGRTWGSSVASSMTTAGTSLSPVQENSQYWSSTQLMPGNLPPPAPAPTGALPAPPGLAPVSVASAKLGSTQRLPSPAGMGRNSVQDRRLSGQKGKRLKIETSVESKAANFGSSQVTSTQLSTQPAHKTAPATLALPSSRSDDSSVQEANMPKTSRSLQISAPYPTPFQATFSDFSGSAASPPGQALNSALSHHSSVGLTSASTSPGNTFTRTFNERGILRNNGSSLSLRSKGFLSPSTDMSDVSPVTPSSLAFPGTAANTANVLDLQVSEPSAKPRPLEPCPESQMLRPYWLLRCFHQSLTHPDGGYLTTKLCIPRKAWQVANVKLKHVEDKVANCDMLTAALLKLRLTDTLDADAVLRELESFEAVMMQVQTNLSKKLGNEVGPQNISSLFKEAPVTNPPSDTAITPNESIATNSFGSGKSSSKTYFSLRKLRGKNSETNLARTYTSVHDSLGKDGLSLKSVPMTSSLVMPSLRGWRKEESAMSNGGASGLKADGPNATYMNSLSKLCDAAQILDQIARQVEDPGLKHSSPTHVGLELSSKHASEFFGLYICRFVLQDITLLAEKHVKRASEYALN